jgi:hypothetical protein
MGGLELKSFGRIYSLLMAWNYCDYCCDYSFDKEGKMWYGSNVVIMKIKIMIV